MTCVTKQMDTETNDKLAHSQVSSEFRIIEKLGRMIGESVEVYILDPVVKP